MKGNEMITEFDGSKIEYLYWDDIFNEPTWHYIYDGNLLWSIDLSVNTLDKEHPNSLFVTLSHPNWEPLPEGFLDGLLSFCRIDTTKPMEYYFDGNTFMDRHYFIQEARYMNR